MAGIAYGSFAVGDPNINNVMLQLAGVTIGYNALTLTQMSTTNVPAIAAGSKIEVGGTLFKFDAEEAISGSPSDGTVYIMLVPSGSSITAQFTNTAPTWSDSKQGWYGTGGSAGNRYVLYVIQKKSSGYIKQKIRTFKTLFHVSGFKNISSTTAPGEYNVITQDLMSEYNTATAPFKAKNSGVYRCTWSGFADIISGSGSGADVTPVMNGSTAVPTGFSYSIKIVSAVGYGVPYSVTYLLSLNTGDTLGANLTAATGSISYFNHLVVEQV